MRLHLRAHADRLAGLTDEELTRKPADWCWTVRRVAGGFRADGSSVSPPAPPLSTLAWRLDHLVHVYGASRNSEWLGHGPLRPLPPPIGSPDGELGRLEVGYQRWRTERSTPGSR